MPSKPLWWPSGPVRWNVVSQRRRRRLSHVLKSCILLRWIRSPVLLLTPLSLCTVLTRSAPGARSWVCKPGVLKSQDGPIYTLTSVCETGPRSATPSPYLVAHRLIDNSKSINGMARRGNSRTDICACRPCKEERGGGHTGEHRANKTFWFSPHCYYKTQLACVCSRLT